MEAPILETYYNRNNGYVADKLKIEDYVNRIARDKEQENMGTLFKFIYLNVLIFK